MTQVDADQVVYEVEREHFDLARHLFDEIWYDRAFIGAAFAGRQPARLFVDDLSTPIAAVLARSFEYYVAGSPDSPLRSFIRDAPSEAGVFGDLFGYSTTNIPWTLAIQQDHGDRLVMIARRAFYWPDSRERQDALEPYRAPLLKVDVCPMDVSLVERLRDDLHENVGFFWRGWDDFLSHSFGYCLLVDDTPVSIAYCIAIGDGEANIAVYTAPEHRQHGHALRVCAAYIDHCLRLGLVPTWDCDSDNLRSANLARKLGFVELPPFSQLSPPLRGKIGESTGRWSKDVRDDGTTAYRRNVPA